MKFTTFLTLLFFSSITSYGQTTQTSRGYVIKDQTTNSYLYVGLSEDGSDTSINLQEFLEQGGLNMDQAEVIKNCMDLNDTKYAIQLTEVLKTFDIITNMKLKMSPIKKVVIENVSCVKAIGFFEKWIELMNSEKYQKHIF